MFQSFSYAWDVLLWNPEVLQFRAIKYTEKKEEKEMAMFQNPGAFFLGTLVPSEQKFLKVLLENARKNGYTKFV